LGIARAGDVDGLLDLGIAFTSRHRPAGPRVAVVSTSGGSGILAADAIDVPSCDLALAGLSRSTQVALTEIVPSFGSTKNPVDVTASVMKDPRLLQRALDVVADDDAVDAVIACFCVLADDQVVDIVAAAETAADRTGKPVFIARTGADFVAPSAAEVTRKAGLPAFPTPDRAVRALAGLWQTSKPSSSGNGTAGQAPIRTQRDSPPTDEAALKAFLASHAIPVPAGRIAGGPDDAVAATVEVGGVAVAKAVVPGLIHKSEMGGVVIGVTPESAADVYARLAGLGGEVLIEEHVRGEAEMLVGIAPSPLGQVLTVATGGVHAEVLDDVAVRLLPLTRDEAAGMIAELRAAPLLDGYRGGPPLDVDALIDIMMAVSDLAGDWPVGSELDLNPVALLPDGARVLDAVFLPHRTEA
jgi:acyl-CoA synthetase (NDP forming)